MSIPINLNPLLAGSRLSDTTYGHIGSVESVPLVINVQLDSTTTATVSLVMTLHDSYHTATIGHYLRGEIRRRVTAGEHDDTTIDFVRYVTNRRELICDAKRRRQNAGAIVNGEEYDVYLAAILSKMHTIDLDIDITYTRQLPKITKLHLLAPPIRHKPLKLKRLSAPGAAAIEAALRDLLNSEWVASLAAMPFIQFALTVKTNAFVRNLDWIPDHRYSVVHVENQHELRSISGAPSQIDHLEIAGLTKLTSLKGLSPALRKLALVDVSSRPIDVSELSAAASLNMFYFSGTRLPNKISAVAFSNISQIRLDLTDGNFWEATVIEDSEIDSAWPSTPVSRRALVNTALSNCLQADRRQLLRELTRMRRCGIDVT